MQKQAYLLNENVCNNRHQKELALIQPKHTSFKLCASSSLIQLYPVNCVLSTYERFRTQRLEIARFSYHSDLREINF